MFLRIIITKVKALFFFFFSLIRRALCCFRRRRRPSGDGVPLTHVGVVSNSAKTPNEEWTDWNVAFNESKPNTVQDHIEIYRKQLAAARQAQLEAEKQAAEEEDLFGDMAPKITRQKKVFVDNSQQGEQMGPSSRLLSLEPDELGLTAVVVFVFVPIVLFLV